ncbi:MAG: hypothetical protein HC938_05735 [Nitrospira sp.]|nr:hypothetical protein [Nitrospira sp.]
MREPVMVSTGRTGRLAFSLCLLVCLLMFPMGCAVERAGGLGSSIEARWQPWDILETHTGRVITFADLVKDLEQQNIVYLGRRAP